MSIYVHACRHVCTHVCLMSVSVCVCVHVCTRVSMCDCLSVCTHVCVLYIQSQLGHLQQLAVHFVSLLPPPVPTVTCMPQVMFKFFLSTDHHQKFPSIFYSQIRSKGLGSSCHLSVRSYLFSTISLSTMNPKVKHSEQGHRTTSEIGLKPLAIKRNTVGGSFIYAKL